MFTPGEVSKMLGIPGSTIRRYVAEFGEFLSDDANRQRGRMFTEHDVDVIATIRGLTQQGEKLKDIGPQLSEVVSAPKESEDSPPESALVLIQNQLEQYAATQQQQAETIAQLRADQETLQGEIEQMRQDLAQSQRPFWEKILKRKP